MEFIDENLPRKKSKNHFIKYAPVIGLIESMVLMEEKRLKLDAPDRFFPGVLWHMVSNEWGITRAYKCKMYNARERKMLGIVDEDKYLFWRIQRVPNKHLVAFETREALNREGGENE